MSGSTIRANPLWAAFLLVSVVAGEAQRGPTLNALTVPAEALPRGCSLKQPAPTRVPSAEGTAISIVDASPFRTNPWSGTDRKLVTEIRLVMDGTPPLPDGPPLARRDAAAFLSKLADNVLEAYRAAYVAADGSEVGVLAVRFNDDTLANPEGPSGTTNRPRGFSSRFVRGATVVLVTAPFPNECARAVDDYIRSLK